MNGSRDLLKCTVLAIGIALAGCGGGGDGEDAPDADPSPEGAYSGTLTGGAYSAFQLLALENGEFWSIYGTQTTSLFEVAGFVQGSWTSNNGTLTSSNSKDFGVSPALAASTSASYNTNTRVISGTISASNVSVNFNGSPIAGSTYDYNAGASLAAVAGSWSTTGLAGEAVALNIHPSGTLTATADSGCNLSGTVAPRASGKNVFNVSLAFGVSCPLAGQTASGIAIVYPLQSGQTQLLVAVVNSARTLGSAVIGTR